MTEYRMAKIAGEMLCTSMNRAGVHIIVSRLPRLLTDQTATVPVETENLVCNVQSSQSARQ